MTVKGESKKDRAANWTERRRTRVVERVGIKENLDDCCQITFYRQGDSLRPGFKFPSCAPAAFSRINQLYPAITRLHV